MTIDEEKPVPHVAQMTQTGVLVIGWNMKMQRPDNITEIEVAQVAERTMKRQLSGEIWFVNKTNSESERARLYAALEVRIVQNPLDDPDQINFTWEVLGFNEDFFWIQLYFEDVSLVSANGRTDQVSVTFRGVEFFKSVLDKEVEYGTTLTWDLHGQMNLKAADKIDLLDVTNYIVAVIALFIIPFFFLGTLLPTWLLFNTL